MKFDIKLRPHHLKSFLVFERKKLRLISDEEYIKSFKKTNGLVHNDGFIKFWKNFWTKLHNKPNLRILYINDFDEICKNCDIKNDCKKKNSRLNLAVKKLDTKAIELLGLEEGKIYTVEEIRKKLLGKI